MTPMCELRKWRAHRNAQGLGDPALPVAPNHQQPRHRPASQVPHSIMKPLEPCSQARRPRPPSAAAGMPVHPAVVLDWKTYRIACRQRRHSGQARLAHEARL